MPRPLPIALVVGNRPQFVKLRPVREALAAFGRPTLVHTGQHHDFEMSQVHFQDLGLPAPDLDLGISGGGHGEQTGRLLMALERAFLDLKPRLVILFGDTNSTLAAALAAVKLHVRIAHVESGPRLNDGFESPEEANRVLTERVADLLFPPSDACRANLARDGRVEGVHLVGDTMYDTFLAAERLSAGRPIVERARAKGPFALVTLHRPRNVDDPAVFSRILDFLGGLPMRALLPLHPRTRKNLDASALSARAAALPNVELLPPLGYLDLNALLPESELVITDSGGLQKEAYFARRRCLTLYRGTPWPEIGETGYLRTADPVAGPLDPALTAWEPGEWQPLFGDGSAGRRIAEACMGFMPS